jgi:hypothetical protein
VSVLDGGSMSGPQRGNTPVTGGGATTQPSKSSDKSSSSGAK